MHVTFKGPFAFETMPEIQAVKILVNGEELGWLQLTQYKADLLARHACGPVTVEITGMVFSGLARRYKRAAKLFVVSNRAHHAARIIAYSEEEAAETAQKVGLVKNARNAKVTEVTDFIKTYSRMDQVALSTLLAWGKAGQYTRETKNGQSRGHLLLSANPPMCMFTPWVKIK